MFFAFSFVASSFACNFGSSSIKLLTVGLLTCFSKSNLVSFVVFSIVAMLPLVRPAPVSVLAALDQISEISELKPVSVLPEYPQTAEAISFVEGALLWVDCATTVNDLSIQRYSVPAVQQICERYIPSVDEVVKLCPYHPSEVPVSAWALKYMDPSG